ncbi:PTS mannose/fructose/sorbose/N-acetylgalactosamine transporter subunit IIC [Enterococcus sp. DIV0756]|uniref:PTS mannose/fructose/sorbose/N-acetylgalactosamine transporter subunit IIC n=1 Tax=Enterococcus sp. DIV0756 TaxID=2774636 RepID=UPI003F1F6A25
MVQALLMGLLALLNGIQWPLSWWLIREPIMAGFWVGLIYGDPVQGVIIGATINVAYLGWISAGGANASDLYWAGLLGTFVAIQGGMSIEQSAAFAIPIGLLGNYVHVAYMTLASFWPTRMDKLADKGDWKGIRKIQMFGGPFIVLFLRALPVFFIALFGSEYIQIIINSLPDWAMNGLGAVGKILPALGMSMLLKFMLKKELIPFFIIGFAIAAYTGMTDLMMYVIIAVAIGLLMLKLGFAKEEGETENG